MVSFFRLVKQDKFLGKPAVPCAIYEWQPPNPPKFGRFKTRFQVPLDDGPRIFYLDPLIRSLVKPELGTQFLLRACKYGYKWLAELEKHSEADAQTYGMYHALFRNRHAGHIGISREFASPREYVDFSPDQGQPSLITPGLESIPTREQNVGHTQSQTALRMLRDAMLNTSGESTKHVMTYYRKLFFSGRRPRPAGEGVNEMYLPIDTLPGRSDLDLKFTDGNYRTTGHPRWGDTVATVRQSLMYGPCSNADFAGIFDGTDRFCFCIAQIRHAYLNRRPQDFDRWLKNVREHGFLALIKDGRQLCGEERKQAMVVAKTMFCRLLWSAYQAMARCYGVLMLLISLHLAFDEEIKATPVEELIFRSLHLPQIYLAGLPLSFLTRSQMRWIIVPLHTLWRDERFDSEAYDPLTALLGVFGQLLQQRRTADRKMKAGVKRHEHSEVDHLRAEEEESDLVLNASQWDGSTKCKTCRQPLSFDRLLAAEESRITFVMYCKKCDKEVVFRCEPSSLELLAADSARDGCT